MLKNDLDKIIAILSEEPDLEEAAWLMLSRMGNRYPATPEVMFYIRRWIEDEINKRLLPPCP